MKKSFVIQFLFILGSSVSFAKVCIPPNQFVSVAHKGSYHRIHPSGDFVLMTGENPPVSLIDLRGLKDGKSEAKIIPTVLRGEAYPVEPNWEFITSPDLGISRVNKDEKGLAFFRFADLIDKTPENYKTAKPAMNDPENDGYYHSIAETQSSGSSKTFRATRWNKNQKIEYKVKPGQDGKPALERGDRSQFCSNLTKLREAAAEQAEVEYTNAYRAMTDGKNAKPPLPANKIHKLEEELEIKEEAKMRAMSYSNLSNPILSKDGQFLAIRYGSPATVKVYRLATNGDCESEIDTGYEGSKVSFSYPEPGQLPKIVFTTDDWLGGPLEMESADLEKKVDEYKIKTTGKRVILYDLESRKSFQINQKTEPIAESPGFTRDGRVIYSTGKGLAIVDSRRILTENKDCIETQKSGSSFHDKNGNPASSGPATK